MAFEDSNQHLFDQAESCVKQGNFVEASGLFFQLHEALLQNKQSMLALECLIDAYLLAKETKSENETLYKKKIPALIRQFFPEMDDQRKGELIRERVYRFRQQFNSENVIQANFQQSSSSHGVDPILFKSLNAAEIEKVRSFSSTYTYDQGEVIYQPMDPIFGFSCLLEGQIKVAYRGSTLATLEGGAIIDEAEFSTGTRRFFEVIAETPVTLLWINKAAFAVICKRDQSLALHFLWHFYKSLSLKINALMETAEIPAHLHETSDRRKLSSLEIRLFSDIFDKTNLINGHFLFKKQSSMETFYILLEGEIEICSPLSPERIRIQPGEFFSELSLISHSQEHVLDAKVTSPKAQIITIDRRQLQRLDDVHERYKVMEFLWKVFSWKYFELVSFRFHVNKKAGISAGLSQTI